MSQPLDRHNPDFPYKKKEIDIKQSPEGYPIIERMNNGLLFPEGPKDIVDFLDYEDI
jgi:ubiquinone biosynthesis protein COQ9